MNMKLTLIPILSFLQIMFAYAQDQSTKELIVVPSVDLNKYAGLWYEIARLPNWFQKQCVGDVTAMYFIQDDGTIKVVNRCRNGKGEIEEAEGQAKRVCNDSSNAKLKVRFAPKFLSFLPFVWGNYWIIDLDPEYRYAVVGEPDRKYLWILSRTPILEEDTLQAIISRIKTKGYDLVQLIRTEQSNNVK
jgi:apolipoprotein D and lipocalin family protein